MNHQTVQKLIFFLYARKSSESEDRQVQSIDDQIARLKELASPLGIVIKEIFIEAKSAKRPYNRPVFSEMLKRIEKGEANGILCWELNRLSRNPVDSGTVHWMLQEGAIQCIQTIDKKYQPGDNVLLFHIESGMANQYIIDLRKNCMRGMEGKADRGWKPAMAPIGYANDMIDRTIKPDPERFAIIRQMWDMMLTGNYSPQEIRKIANEEWGLRTPVHKKRGGIELAVSHTYVIFGNIFYTGLFEWRGRLYQGSHKPMITLAEYDRVQMLLGRKGSPRKQHHSFAYTGLIRCHTCGLMYTATEKMKLVKSTGIYKQYVYYHCGHKNKAIPCINPPVPLAFLETQIERELERFTIIPEFMEWALEYLDGEKGKAARDADSNRAMLEKTLREAEKELASLTRMCYKELIDDASFINERDVLRNSITKLTAQLNEQTNYADMWLALTAKAFHFATYAHNSFVHGSTEKKREIVSNLGSNYSLNNKELLFKASDWLIPIKKGYPGLYAEFKRVEPHKTLDTEGWNTLLRPIILIWSTIVEEVRTGFKDRNDTNISIPSLEQSVPHEITSIQKQELSSVKKAERITRQDRLSD